MKWTQLLGTAVVLCGAVLLSACGGGEVSASTTPPAASSEAPAASQPTQPEAPSSSEPAASSASAEPASSSEETKPENKMVVQYGTLIQYDTGDQKEVILPSGKFTKIRSGCFQGNTKLETVVIPEGVTEIGMRAFAGCFNLKYVKLPKSLTTIEQSAFLDCKALKTIEFPENSRLELYSYAFGGSGLTELELPANIFLMDKVIFANCDNLKQVRIDVPGGIPEGMFSSCTALKRVSLGKDVTEIQQKVFESCTNLTEVWYKGDWTALTVREDNEPFENAEHHTGTPAW